MGKALQGSAAKAAQERERLRKKKEAAIPETAAVGGGVAPKYAGAVNAYASGKMSMTQVAEEFGLERSSLGSYLRGSLS